MKAISAGVMFGMILALGASLQQPVLGQGGPNIHAFAAPGHDIARAAIPQFAPLGQAFLQAGRQDITPVSQPLTSVIQSAAPVVQAVASPVSQPVTPVIQPAFTSAAQPFSIPMMQPVVTSAAQPLSTPVIQPVMTSQLLTPAPIAVPPVQSGTASALTAPAVAAPSSSAASQFASDTFPLLPAANLVGSPTVVQTDKTPRPIVKLPATGPLRILYFKASALAGYTLVITSRTYAISFVDLPGSYLQGEAGTAFEVTSTGNLLIKDGTALIGTGRNPLTVSTRLADVRIGADGVALIETGDFGPAKIIALQSSSGAGIEVALANGKTAGSDGTQTFSVAPSSELVVSEHPTSDEELIAGDGVERKDWRTLLDCGDWHVVRAGVPSAQLIRRHPLLAAAAGSQQLAQAPAMKALLDQYKEQLREAPASSQKQAAAQEDFIGISFTQSVAVPVVPGVRAARLASLAPCGQGRYELTRGTLFIAAEQELRLDTPAASVVARPRSVLIISADASRTQVLNLFDRRTGDVKLLVGKTYFPLSPGKEARVLPNQPVNGRRLTLGDGIGRRRMRVVTVDRDVRVVLNEFSIPDALAAHPVLKPFSASRSAQDRPLLDKIVKTAAAIATATAGSRETYSSAAVP